MVTEAQHNANVKHLASTGSQLMTAFQLILAAPILGLAVLVVGFTLLVIWTAIFG